MTTQKRLYIRIPNRLRIAYVIVFCSGRNLTDRFVHFRWVCEVSTRATSKCTRVKTIRNFRPTTERVILNCPPKDRTHRNCDINALINPLEDINMWVSLLYGIALLVITWTFQLWPDYNHILYLGPSSAVVGGTCTKYTEWAWMFGIGSLLLLVPNLILFMIRSKRTTYKNPKKEWPQEVWKCWILFLLFNIIWLLAALYQPFYSLFQKESSLLRYVEVVGGRAAWPAYWNLLFVLVPVQRVSSLRHLLTLSNSSSSSSFSSHIEMIPYHIWAGYAIFFWLSLHTVLLSIVYGMKNTWSQWWEKMIPFRHYYTEGVRKKVIITNGVYYFAIFYKTFYIM